MPKGKKICPLCGNENGVRTANCQCGHRFAIKEQVVKEKPASIEASSNVVLKEEKKSPPLKVNVSCPIIQTPAGRCPYKPEGYVKGWTDGVASDQVVIDWALKVFSHGNYLPQAIVYWAHQFWDINGPNIGEDYNRVRSIIVKLLCVNQEEAR